MDVVEWGKANPPKGPYDGFEWHQVHGDPRTLNTLVMKGVLNVVLKTNKCTVYRLAEVATVEKAFADYQGLARPPEEAQVPPDLFKVVVGHEEKKEIIRMSIG